MNELWQRITTWFANNVPPDLFSLAEGANEAEIKATESILGLRLPDDVRESYLLHNGSNEWAIFENQGLLSLDELIRKWRIMQQILESGVFQGLGPPPELLGPITSAWWNARWIPVTDDGSGDYICIDMDPADGGRIGQVIRTHHEAGPLRVLAPSFREFLSRFADDLEAGKYYYDEYSLMVRRHQIG